MVLYVRPADAKRLRGIASAHRLALAETAAVLLDGWERLPERTRERVLRRPINAKTRSGVAAVAPEPG